MHIRQDKLPIRVYNVVHMACIRRTNNHHLSHFIEVILLEQQQNNGEEEEENFDVSDQVGNIMKDETIKQ